MLKKVELWWYLFCSSAVTYSLMSVGMYVIAVAAGIYNVVIGGVIAGAIWAVSLGLAFFWAIIVAIIGVAGSMKTFVGLILVFVVTFFSYFIWSSENIAAGDFPNPFINYEGLHMITLAPAMIVSFFVVKKRWKWKDVDA